MRSGRCALRYPVIFLFALMILSFSLINGLLAVEREERLPVLILHSYHKAEWTDSLLLGMDSVLGGESDLDIHVEYMDTKKNCSPEYLALLYEAFRIKYSDTFFRVVLVTDNDALEFALEHGEEVLHRAPLVFCGINDFTPALLKGNTEVTGVVEQGDFLDTLRLAFSVRPEAATVYLICDQSKTGLINKDGFLTAIHEVRPDVQVHFLNHHTSQELQSVLTKAAPTDFAFFLAFWIDRAGRNVSPAELGKIFRKSALPVFGRSEWMIGKGMTGGKCVSGFHQGEAAAQKALRLLRGEAVAEVPILLDSPNRFMFDYTELYRHRIELTGLPQESIISNLPVPYFQVNKSTMFVLVGSLVVLSVLLTLLIITLRQRRLAVDSLKISEARFRTVVENTPTIIFAIDPEGFFTLSEGRGLKLLGLKGGEVVGQSAFQFYAGSPNIIEGLRSTLKGRRSTWQVTLPSGLTFDAFTEPILGKEGDVIGAIGVALDITSRVQAEQALRASEEDLRTTLYSIGDGVIVTDTAGLITRMNPVAEHLTGWGYREASGRPLLEVFSIVSSSTRQVLPSPVEKVLSSGEVVPMANHTVLLSRDGHEYQIADSGAPIRNSRGEMIGVVLVFRDVTEEYTLQEQLRHSQKMDAIGQLAGGIAHDFNNMLGGILGAAELLDDSVKENQKARLFVKMIMDSAERAAGLTDKLLTFARKQAPASSVIDVHEVLSQTVSMLKSTVDRRIEILVTLSAKTSLVIGDPSQLQSAFLNLGINASHAMPEGGILKIDTDTLEVDEEFCRTCGFSLRPGMYLQILFEDNGCGIPAEVLPRIFEPFFTTKMAGKGTGLGLAAVFGTVQLHQGAITVESREGSGTTFQLILPLTQDGVVTPVRSSLPVLGGGRILVVDDEPVMRSTGKSILENLGYTVVVADNGRRALEIFAKNPGIFDLVLLDMVMPEMNGRDCFREMKKIFPGVCVVLASGFSREEDIRAMKEEGLRGFIRKPFRSSRLSQVVDEALNPAR